ncbi:hypothetical protein A2U01_0104616, partial [Trifolium medium]|nr:hypothetical protein [Trifolium medium]
GTGIPIGGGGHCRGTGGRSNNYCGGGYGNSYNGGSDGVGPFGLGGDGHNNSL